MIFWSTRETCLSIVALSILAACADDVGTPYASQAGSPSQVGGASNGKGGSSATSSAKGGTKNSSSQSKQSEPDANDEKGGSSGNQSEPDANDEKGGSSGNQSEPDTNDQKGGSSGSQSKPGTTSTAKGGSTSSQSSTTQNSTPGTGGVQATGGAPYVNPWQQGGSSFSDPGSAKGGTTATSSSQPKGGASATTTAASTSSGNSKCASAVTGGTCPAKQCPSGASDCGCYTVSGLGARKKAILDAGGDSRFIASAMMETENLKADYAHGDNKSGDAFNAGCCKQNWYMIRQCHAEWNSKSANDYETASAMNSDLKLDIQVYNECRAKWSESVWFAGHRNGQTGLQTGQAPDLDLFLNASHWTQTNLENGHLCDDVRFWVQVRAIVVD